MGIRPDLSVIQRSVPDTTLTLGAFQVLFSGTTISQSLSTGGIMGIPPQIYPLFTNPSEGKSYPDLRSIPGPFLWHNYQPVRIYGWHHGDQPISICYSPVRLRVDPTLTSGASQVHFSGTVISQAESMCGIMGVGADLSVIQWSVHTFIIVNRSICRACGWRGGLRYGTPACN